MSVHQFKLIMKGILFLMTENIPINKYKIFPSMEAAMQAAQDEPRKTFKKMFGIFKKEKCLARGVTIGGKHMDEYMPQFINFFKENLL